MPLFECEVCGTVDNTALTNFWTDVMVDHKAALCTTCESGKWHNMFKQQTVEQHEKEFPKSKVDYPKDRLIEMRRMAAKENHA